MIKIMAVAVDIKDVRTRIIAKLVAIEAHINNKNFSEAERFVENFFVCEDYPTLHAATIKTNEYSQPILAHQILDELLPVVRGRLYFSSKYIIGLLKKTKFS